MWQLCALFGESRASVTQHLLSWNLLTTNLSALTFCISEVMISIRHVPISPNMKDYKNIKLCEGAQSFPQLVGVGSRFEWGGAHHAAIVNTLSGQPLKPSYF